MELRSLGTSGILVSPIGLGTVKVGRNTGMKYPGGDGDALPSDDVLDDLMRTCVETGVNLVDTAPAYGTSEARLGEAMARNNWFGGRDRWILSTKVGEEHDARRGSTFNFTPGYVRDSVDRSLARLGTEHLDIVLVHSDGRDREIVRSLGTIDALEQLSDEGVVRTFGISTKTVDGAMGAIERLAPTRRGVVMLTLNPRDRDDLPCVRAAHDAGVGVLIKKALASGHLEEVEKLQPELVRQHGDAAGASIAFSLREPVSSVVVGTTKTRNLRHAVEVACRA